MERTIFPLEGTLNNTGLLVDVWSSGMTRIVSLNDPDYMDLLSMATNPPGSKTDDEIMEAVASEGTDLLNRFERERLELIIKTSWDQFLNPEI